ncbi:Phosphatidylinositol:ceramide phosphoinositol transferase (IPC synthase) [Tilletia horrida]|nr:Phosphatidylinositol:ceramide phosphoinositol transferase (IPC synthase) [Tilletia horrida]
MAGGSGGVSSILATAAASAAGALGPSSSSSSSTGGAAPSAGSAELPAPSSSVASASASAQGGASSSSSTSQQQQQQQLHPAKSLAHSATMAKLRRRCPSSIAYILSRILTASTRLETSHSPSINLRRLRAYHFSRGEKIKYAILLSFALFSLWIMRVPGFPLKLAIPLLYAGLLLMPITSQFFLPAAPILCWLLFFYSSKFIPATARPHIWVSLLPTLETIWYGANISDILTQFGHPILDILAWFPYGVIHFVGPFVVAACLFVFGPPGAVKFFGSAFGFLNLIGVFIQVLLPCAPPWYELREGLTPANYSMKGSPAGLARIDALFHGHGYTLTFSNAPVPFGAFPSLHAGCATMEALFCSYFFPIALNMFRGRLRVDSRLLYWAYCFWLYWCTMYLMHHYLIDLVAGACLATLSFYFFLTDEMRIAMEQNYPYRNSAPAPLSAGPSVSRPGSAFGTRRTPAGAGASYTGADGSGGHTLPMSVFPSSTGAAGGTGGGGAPGDGDLGSGAAATVNGAIASLAEAILSPPIPVPSVDEEAQAPVLMSSASASALRATSSGGLISRTASPALNSSPMVGGPGSGSSSGGIGGGSGGGNGGGGVGGNGGAGGGVAGSGVGSSLPGTPHSRSGSGGGSVGGAVRDGFTPISAGIASVGIGSAGGGSGGAGIGGSYFGTDFARAASPRPPSRNRKRDTSEANRD